MAISGKVGAVYEHTIAANNAFTDKPTTSNLVNTDAGGQAMPTQPAYTRYRITDRSLAYWDRCQILTVKKNGVVQTTGFRIEYCGGYVEWGSYILGVWTPAALLNTDVVLVSGQALPIGQALGGFGWKADIDVDVKDVTTYASAGWKEFAALFKGFIASFEEYWLNPDNLTLANNTAQDDVIVLYVDAGANKRYEGMGILKKDSIQNNVTDVVKETVEFQGTTPLYYREG